ncbi:MAG: metallophosphoesterase [Anaerolineales bacterium]|nr:metallophosphoesterase [Anaerolineales bacterium]
MLKFLSVSDQIDPRVYSDSLKERYDDVAFVISCGDLSYMYLEYILTTLNRPLYFVHGNHDPKQELNFGEPRSYPLGADNLHRRIVRNHGLLMAGVEGSIQYNRRTPYQYPQYMMWNHVFKLVPGLLYNRLVYGRFLDLFITHAPPQGIHEGSDWTHQGIKAFRWLINIFQPTFHIHGHIHLYRPDEVKETVLGKTRILNTFQSRITEISQELLG